MSHAHHDHHHGFADHQHVGSKRLRAAFLLNGLFTVVELGGAWWTNSSAVLGGALHDIGDCLILGAAWYLQRVSLRGRDARYSYGYGRYSMLGGWLASIVLGIGSVALLAFTISRINMAAEPYAPGIMAIAVFGLVMNFLAIAALRGGHSMNEKGARLHLLEDVMSWAVILVGGLAMFFSQVTWIDPLMSLGIALFIGWNAMKVFKEGTGILMQRLPSGIDEQRITQALRALPNVLSTHDQHTWTLDGHYTVLTVHIVTDVAEPEAQATLKQTVRETLSALGVQHATIEMERANEICALQHH